MVVPQAKVCEVGGTDQGLLLPLFGDAEARWPDWLQAILYLLGLLWCFMGVAIIAEVFMGAIEEITSKKKRVRNPHTGRMCTVKVWNDTVANLTLMALGSSAPEILLNVKEVFENQFFAGDLGPMTIVGSAAFNLMIILAVCVSAIPSGEVRAIKDIGVYSVTAASSIFAYVWLFFIVAAEPSPNRVEVWEGVLTFLFFPLLVFIALLADVGKLPGTRKPPKGDMPVYSESTKEEIEYMVDRIHQKYGTDLTDMQVAALMDFESTQGGQAHSRAFHRVNATRWLFKGKTLKKSAYTEGKTIALDRIKKNSETKVDTAFVTFDETSFVAFEEKDYVVLESKGPVELKVIRSGNLGQEAAVHFQTEHGTAMAESDYVHTEGDLIFQPGEEQKVVTVPIVNDPNGSEDTEDFFVQLSMTNGATATVLGEVVRARVCIVDENHPGKFAFEQEQMTIQRPKVVTPIHVTVERRRGFDGSVNIEYCTEQDTATAGEDFEALHGTLEFEPQQRFATITVNILPKDDYEGKEVFRIILSDPAGKAMFDETTDGGKESSILTVFLCPRQLCSGHGLVNTFRFNRDQLKVGHAKWKEQFWAAVHCHGDEDAQKGASIADWIIHGIALPWKLFFACVPPVEYGGGWWCFIVALLAIGFVTVLIGDLAALLGCAVGISDFATAITLVALGTSLPDTFASKQAAIQDEYADASIGNVTGSNSVNVFLGLGLPWMIATIYWASVTTPGEEWLHRYGEEFGDMYPNGGFIVRSRGLGLSVTVFSGCSFLCIVLLALRRKFLGGELGGPDYAKWATSSAFVLLWIVFLVVSVTNE